MTDVQLLQLGVLLIIVGTTWRLAYAAGKAAAYRTMVGFVLSIDEQQRVTIEEDEEE